jgi:hypothetical protein
MEWLLLLLAGGGAVKVARTIRARRVSRRDLEAELEVVRRLADEDVVVLGEQLQRLGADAAQASLGPEGRADLQRALDAYESAQRKVQHLDDPGKVSDITDTLSEGRYAMACVEARVAGRPVPGRRAPCFFNPQHGPSSRDVLWTTGRYGTRTVPACTQDAARVAAHEQPEVRSVTVGDRSVPYWDAGSPYTPDRRGYFPGGIDTTGLVGMAWAFDPGPPDEHRG